MNSLGAEGFGVHEAREECAYKIKELFQLKMRIHNRILVKDVSLYVTTKIEIFLRL